ncbi:hypothetical protein [Aeromicrobium sp. UC242_57]|uniref:hypothetical protein n=1 Tax=Aeromicrobium sp. UC242_57 TaxID=3374624 RepID=UPI0037B575D7
MRTREVLASRRDDVDAGAQQRQQIFVVLLVRHLKAWRMHDDLWPGRDELVEVTRRDDAGRVTSGDVAGVATDLLVAVDVQADQLRGRAGR